MAAEASRPRLPWGYILKRTLRSFGTAACTDLAAGLTYFGVLSLFPAMIALVSVLGLVGQSKAGIDALFGMVDQLAPGMLTVVRAPIESLASSPATGWALVIGVVGAVSLMIFFSALQGVFVASLYQYASGGQAAPGFDRDALAQAFVPKRR